MSDGFFEVVPLDTGTHDRNQFDCDTPLLNRYLREQVSQDVRRRVAACFVAVEEQKRIAGYYTLASCGLPLEALPEKMRGKLPRYPTVPAVRMGRLAVDRVFQGRGLGGALLADAFARTIRAEIAAYALVVDAKDERAAAFYRHHGFIAFPSMPLALFHPLISVRGLL